MYKVEKALLCVDGDLARTALHAEMRRRYSSEDVEDLAQLVYPLVANTDLAGDLQWLYAGA